jgi:hypothetical protein
MLHLRKGAETVVQISLFFKLTRLFTPGVPEENLLVVAVGWGGRLVLRGLGMLVFDSERNVV